MKNFKMATAEHEAGCGALLGMGPCVTAGLHTCELALCLMILYVRGENTKARMITHHCLA